MSETPTIVGDPSNGTTAYTYDQLGRLTGYSRAATSAAYEWQAVPNRSSVQQGTNPAITTDYDDANRPMSDSAGGSYGHDAEGRLTARPGQLLEVGAELPLDI
jgi:YD repeat-containing protein